MLLHQAVHTLIQLSNVTKLTICTELYQKLLKNYPIQLLAIVI